VLLLGAPDGFEEGTLGEPPDGVMIGRTTRAPADVILLFHTARAGAGAADAGATDGDAAQRRAADRLAQAGVKVPTDLTEDVVRELALANALARRQQGRGAERKVVGPASGDPAPRSLAWIA
jgi:hypothetical protein